MHNFEKSDSNYCNLNSSNKAHNGGDNYFDAINDSTNDDDDHDLSIAAGSSRPTCCTWRKVSQRGWGVRRRKPFCCPDPASGCWGPWRWGWCRRWGSRCRRRGNIWGGWGWCGGAWRPPGSSSGSRGRCSGPSCSPCFYHGLRLRSPVAVHSVLSKMAAGAACAGLTGGTTAAAAGAAAGGNRGTRVSLLDGGVTTNIQQITLSLEREREKLLGKTVQRLAPKLKFWNEANFSKYFFLIYFFSFFVSFSETYCRLPVTAAIQKLRRKCYCVHSSQVNIKIGGDKKISRTLQK